MRHAKCGVLLGLLLAFAPASASAGDSRHHGRPHRDRLHVFWGRPDGRHLGAHSWHRHRHPIPPYPLYYQPWWPWGPWGLVWDFDDDEDLADETEDRCGAKVADDAPLDVRDLPASEWSRSERFCAKKSQSEGTPLLACLHEQAEGLRCYGGLYHQRIDPRTQARCEKRFGEDRSGYWSCVAGP